MGRSLTALILSVLVWSTGLAQQPLPSPPPPPRSTETKPETQKPNQSQLPNPNDDLDVVKITTNLVQIDAIVTDKNGKRVTDLKPDEIEMLEDGKPQYLTNFAYISLAPKAVDPQPEPGNSSSPITAGPPINLRPDQVRRTIALVVDDLGLSFESTHHVRESLKKFIGQQMQPGDLVAIIRTGGGIGALQSFTSDKRQLYAAVEKVRWNPVGRSEVSSFGPITNESSPATPNDEGRNRQEELNEFREDIYAVGTLGALNYIVRGLKDLPGRKSVILLSDGFQMTRTDDAFGSSRVLSALRRLTDLANRASVVIYTMHAAGLQTLSITAADDTSGMSAQQVEESLTDRRRVFFDSQDGLSYLAQRTGGLAFKNTNDLAGSIKKVMVDQEGFYLIGYRPDDSTFEHINGRVKFHQISLKIKRPGKYNVRMRSGFYGVTEEALTTVAQTPQQQIVNAITSPFGATGVQLRLTSLFVNDARIGSAMHSFLHVNAKDLEFTVQPDGMHKAVFDIMALTFGDNGQVIDQFSYTQTIQIKEENFSRLMKNGFTYTVTIPVKKPGAYQFRTALRDQSTGKVGSASQFIEVPNIKKNRLTLSGIVMRGMTVEAYLKGLTSAPLEKADNVQVENLPNASSAVRQFQSGMAMAYGFTIYNAQLDKLTGKPKLKTQVRIFRNGEQFFVGNELPYELMDEKDMKRLTVNGGIQLGNKMPPGEYVIQVIVTDLAKEKPRIATQWLDFEVVK
ncbi:MAG: hypothetical protein DMF69_00180 [Acidobacteria bacterium]|nr:MAG: hypothetical protein DMF69_00180 [Acidobacteriota bacterium]